MPTNSIPYQLTRLPVTQKPGVPSRTTSNTRAVIDPIAFGRGVLTPLRRDGKGDFANSADLELVRSEVRQVMNTVASSGSSDGELPWRPEFGSILQLLRFRNLDETTVELARTYVVDSLRTWLFRVRVREALVEPIFTENLLRITVVYDILGTNERTVLERNAQETVDIPVAA